MEAHSQVTINESNKRRKIAENPPSPLPTTQPESISIASPEHDDLSLYGYFTDTESEDEIIVRKEDFELNVWDLWKKVLDIMKTQDDVDKYSLENLNIIQLGNKIGSQTTRKYYSEELINGTGLIVEEIPDSFVYVCIGKFGYCSASHLN